MINKQKFLSSISNYIVKNKFDLPTPGMESDLSSKYFGPDQSKRDELIEKGRMLRQSDCREDILFGYGLVIHTYYYTSLECATNQGRIHAKNFEDYAAHLIHSDPSFFPSDIFKTLATWFPRPKSVKILKGQIYWIFKTKQV